MNIVVLSGNLTKDIEIKTTESGKKVVTNTIAVRRNKDKTDFVNFVAWENNAQYLYDYADKGSKVVLTGEIQVRDYESEGKKKYVTEIIANRIEFSANKQQEKASTVNDDYEITDDDLPF